MKSARYLARVATVCLSTWLGSTTFSSAQSTALSDCSDQNLIRFERLKANRTSAYGMEFEAEEDLDDAAKHLSVVRKDFGPAQEAEILARSDLESAIAQFHHTVRDIERRGFIPATNRIMRFALTDGRRLAVQDYSQTLLGHYWRIQNALVEIRDSEREILYTTNRAGILRAEFEGALSDYSEAGRTHRAARVRYIAARNRLDQYRPHDCSEGHAVLDTLDSIDLDDLEAPEDRGALDTIDGLEGIDPEDFEGPLHPSEDDVENDNEATTQAEISEDVSEDFFDDLMTSELGDALPADLFKSPDATGPELDMVAGEISQGNGDSPADVISVTLSEEALSEILDGFDAAESVDPLAGLNLGWTDEEWQEMIDRAHGEVVAERFSDALAIREAAEVAEAMRQIETQLDEDTSNGSRISQPRAVGAGTIVPIPDLSFDPGLALANLQREMSPEERATFEILQNLDPNRLAAQHARASTGICELDEKTVCGTFSRLNFVSGNLCASAASDAKSACNAALSRAGSRPSVARCQADCVSRGTEAQSGRIVAELARSLVLESIGPLQLRIRDIESEILILEARQIEIRARYETQVIHIYAHSETGATFQHDGPFFEPTAPIYHAGTMPRPMPTRVAGALISLGMRSYWLSKQLTEMNADLASGDPDVIWQQNALDFWDRVSGTPAHEGCTTEPGITEDQNQCLAFCAAQGEPRDNFPGPISTDVCPLSKNALGALSTPEAHRWLERPSDIVLGQDG